MGEFDQVLVYGCLALGLAISVWFAAVVAGATNRWTRWGIGTVAYVFAVFFLHLGMYITTEVKGITFMGVYDGLILIVAALSTPVIMLRIWNVIRPCAALAHRLNTGSRQSM